MNSEEKLQSLDAEKKQIEDNESSDVLDSMKTADKFLQNIIWGILIKCLFIKIPKLIFEACWRSIKFISRLIWKFCCCIYRNFGKIIEFIYRFVKIAVLLGILAVLILWPLMLGALGLMSGEIGFIIEIAWGVLVVIPGITWGIIRWRKRRRAKSKAPETLPPPEVPTTENAAGGSPDSRSE